MTMRTIYYVRHRQTGKYPTAHGWSLSHPGFSVPYYTYAEAFNAARSYGPGYGVVEA